MGKREYRPNPRAIQIMDELDRFREFCADYGYRFREEDDDDHHNRASLCRCVVGSMVRVDWVWVYVRECGAWVGR